MRDITKQTDALAARIGARVKELRNQKKWTQMYMEEKFDINTRYLQRLEAGKTHPNLTTLVKMATIFHTTVADLVK